ncbi:MAG: hypothetical protein K2O12_05055, partial [Muribaculaceae bacterium]|nr:hypothetical protein [Muribaculaceae bacterium]
MSVPDFAFPETVAKHATENFEHAIHTGDSTLMLRSLIDYITAEELITHDNTSLWLARLMSAEAQASGKLSRSLINMLRATVLWRYYAANRAVFDRRNLPVYPYPQQISMWSGEQFRDTITTIIEEALAFKTSLGKAPISTFNGIIDADRLQTIYYPTLYDFVGIKSVEILDSFRHTDFRKFKNYKNQIISDLRAMHRNGSAPYIMYSLDINDNTSPEHMFELYRQNSGSEFSGDI